MPEQPPRDVFGGLPRTRPHRRSDKRSAAVSSSPESPETESPETESPETESAAAKAEPKAKPAAKAKAKPAAAPKTKPATTRRPRSETLRQPAQPAGTPTVARARKPAPASGVELLGTAVQAAAELAEIGLSAGARALRNAIGRLPRP
jgi:hypothetical protein